MTITTVDYGNLNPAFVPSLPAKPGESQTLVMPRGCAEAFTASNLAAVEALVRSQARRRKDDQADLQVHTYCALIPPASLGPRVTAATSGLAPILFVVTSDALSPYVGSMLESEPTGRVVHDPLLGSEYLLGWSVPACQLPYHPELSELSPEDLGYVERLELMLPEQPLSQYLKGKRGGTRPYVTVAICTPSSFALGGFWGGQELLEEVHCAQSLRENYDRVLLDDELADPEIRRTVRSPRAVDEEHEVLEPSKRLAPTPEIRLVDQPLHRFNGWSLEHNGHERHSGLKLVSTGAFV